MSSGNVDMLKKEKKSGIMGGLFSPEQPDSRPPSSMPSSGISQRPPAAPNMPNSDALRTSNSSNNQQQHARPTSTGAGGEANSSDPVVNVQKLESIAPEFQQMLKESAPSSILVTPDGQPSPRKREEERRMKEVEQRKRGNEEKEKGHGDKRRTTR